METEDNTNLQLDTDSIRDRAGVRSSLTDINQIFVFTDEFIEQKETVEKKQQAAKEELCGTVFVKQLGSEAETEVTDLIFLENTEEMLIRNEQEISESRSWSAIWFLPMAVVIVFAAVLFYKMKKYHNKSNRKGKKKYDADNQPEAVA